MVLAADSSIETYLRAIARWRNFRPGIDHSINFGIYAVPRSAVRLVGNIDRGRAVPDEMPAIGRLYRHLLQFIGGILAVSLPRVMISP